MYVFAVIQKEFYFIYLGFCVAFNTVQFMSRRVVERAEETSTYSWSGFCTVNCRPTASNYQLSHLRSGREPNPGLRGGRQECYHSATVRIEKYDKIFQGLPIVIILLVESLIRVMYWVLAAILNRLFKPLNIKFCLIFVHISVH